MWHLRKRIFRLASVWKMMQQFLTHFCGYSGDDRNCRRAGTAFSAPFVFCSLQFTLCKRQGLNEMCYGWMKPRAGSCLHFHLKAKRPASPPESATSWNIYLHGSPRDKKIPTVAQPEQHRFQRRSPCDLQLKLSLRRYRTNQDETLPLINSCECEEVQLSPSCGLQAQRLLWVLFWYRSAVKPRTQRFVSTSRLAKNGIM